MQLTQFGYSPDNFAELVRLSGLTNKGFYEQNSMSRSMFYEYKNGNISIPWHDWLKLTAKYGVSVDAKA